MQQELLLIFKGVLREIFPFFFYGNQTKKKNEDQKGHVMNQQNN